MQHFWQKTFNSQVVLQVHRSRFVTSLGLMSSLWATEDGQLKTLWYVESLAILHRRHELSTA